MAGENVPGACATRNFTYLVRGPWKQTKLHLNFYKLSHRILSYIPFQTRALLTNMAATKDPFLCMSCLLERVHTGVFATKVFESSWCVCFQWRTACAHDAFNCITVFLMRLETQNGMSVEFVTMGLQNWVRTIYHDVDYSATYSGAEPLGLNRSNICFS